ncbi:MAG: ATP-binding cassette domain-containing protein [Chloroflexi bacterium]|nr:MAG: ATP-binding cassette domain-containing protein [Chloroflexota bacterium]
MDVEVKNIHKRFGPVHANNDISVTFKGGNIVGILGENGAGKSTLMKILSGFQPADSGEIWIDGRPVDYHGPRAAIAHGVGMLQQDPLDVPAFTVLENFIYGAPGGMNLNRPQAQRQLSEVSQRFGFDLDPETPINRLSIAQRQQLEIVRLLALGVKLLILDEPTTGISAEQKNVLFEALRNLAKNDGLSVLLVSHKLEDVIALCDEVVVLRAGKLVGTKQLPATTDELVTLMFGEELAPHQPEDIEFGDTVLKLDRVHLASKRLSITDLSLEVRAGEVIGLAGLDGSGQRLMMRACVGLEKCVAGDVFINGQRMTGQAYRSFMQHGVSFGAAGRLEEGLIAGLTLTEHIALVSERGMVIDWARARQHTETQIKLYDVRGHADNMIEQLSGGNQQRVLMALLPENPVVLVLEQPTRGLDVDSARWIWQQLLKRRADGTAIIFSSAELDEIVTYSDRILVFYAGQIYEIRDPDAVSIDELGRLIGGDFQSSDHVERLA